MPIVSLHDREEIAAFLRQHTALHLYALGDLDDFFWPYTVWFALKEAGAIRDIVLLYTGENPPVLLALTTNAESMRDLLRGILQLLPTRLYVHLSPNLAEVLSDHYHIHAHGDHAKMLLTHRAPIIAVDVSATIPLTPSDAEEMQALYAASYPGNWFTPRMLETGQYFGLRDAARLVSVAGVHVYSPRYDAAALGNIVTHPDYRGRGLAAQVSARLCQSLLQNVNNIGLNVHLDNLAAIHTYKRLGFEQVAVYGEYSLELK